jgi:thioredoxin reductase (NADPH)
VIGKDTGALGKAEKIENYYGFTDAVSGTELVQNGIAQARRIGAEIMHDEVVGIGYTDKFSVKTATGEFAADAVVLAMGTARRAANIKGFADFEGKGISYCATCDAFFARGKDVAVLGSGEYALSEAKELLPVVKSVTVITNGQVPTVTFPSEIKVVETKIAELTGGTYIEDIVFADGTKLDTAGVFVAIGVAGSTELARKIGAEIKGTAITVDERMATNIPGLFAAGDCTGGMLQIAKAVYQGAVAGTEAIKFLRG